MSRKQLLIAVVVTAIITSSITSLVIGVFAFSSHASAASDQRASAPFPTVVSKSVSFNAGVSCDQSNPTYPTYTDPANQVTYCILDSTLVSTRPTSMTWMETQGDNVWYTSDSAPHVVGSDPYNPGNTIGWIGFYVRWDNGQLELLCPNGVFLAKNTMVVYSALI